jgi:hypothetical protein
MLLLATSACTLHGKGVKAGLGTFELDKDPRGQSQITEPRPMFGAFTTTDISRWVSLQGEIQFSEKTVGLKTCGPMGCQDGAMTFYFMEFPLFFQLVPIKGPSFRLRLGGGGVFAISMGGHQESNGTETKLKDLSGTNGGVAMATTLEIGAGSGFVTIESRYTRWFAPLIGAQTEMGEDFFAGDMYALLIGYAFP